MDRAPSFDAVRALAPEDQARLLGSCDATERLWAAWAIAARDAAWAEGALGPMAMSEPSPGARRQMIVMLAGGGQRALLETFARDDDDAEVRATAMRYLIFSTYFPDESAARFACERLLTRPDPAMAESVLGHLPAVHSIPLPVLDFLVDRPEPEVRSHLLDHLDRVSIQDPGHRRLLFRMLEQDRGPVLERRVMDRLLTRGPVAEVVTFITGRPAADGLRLATLMLRCGELRSLEWSEVLPLLRFPLPALHGYLLEGADGQPADVSFPWYLDRLAAYEDRFRVPGAAPPMEIPDRDWLRDRVVFHLVRWMKRGVGRALDPCERGRVAALAEASRDGRVPLGWLTRSLHPQLDWKDAMEDPHDEVREAEAEAHNERIAATEAHPLSLALLEAVLQDR